MYFVFIILSVSNNSKCKNDFWENSGRFKMFFGTVVKTVSFNPMYV